MITTEDAAWALWLPSGRQLLTGAISATYRVNTRSLATRPFYFDGAATRSESIISSTDLNFTTLVVPRGALNPKQRQSLGLGRARTIAAQEPPPRDRPADTAIPSTPPDICP